jgi:hypothetical protein
VFTSITVVGHTKSGRGTYKLTVTDSRKPGYTFDPTNSVSSESMTT